MMIVSYRITPVVCDDGRIEAKPITATRGLLRTSSFPQWSKMLRYFSPFLQMCLTYIASYQGAVLYLDIYLPTAAMPPPCRCWWMNKAVSRTVDAPTALQAQAPYSTSAVANKGRHIHNVDLWTTWPSPEPEKLRLTALRLVAGSHEYRDTRHRITSRAEPTRQLDGLRNTSVTGPTES